MNIQQTRNAQKAIRAAIAICENKDGLVNAATVANQAWIDAGKAYPLAVGAYRRYSWLLADLTRMQMQLAEQLRDLEVAAGYPVDGETGCDLREWCGNDIQAAHAEALVLNEWHGFTEEQRAIQNERVGYGLNLLCGTGENNVVDACHVDALIMDSGIKFFTRKQHIQGECSHQAYYMQFATPAIIARVKSRVDLDVLKSSKDGSFNDVYRLTHWDNVIGVVPADVAQMMREAGDYPTLAGSVCLAKAVARSLISE